MAPWRRAGQSQAPLSCAAPRRHASRVALARTLGSTTRSRAVLQQEVRLRRELEQPRRGGAAKYRYAAVANSSAGGTRERDEATASGPPTRARAGSRTKDPVALRGKPGLAMFCR